MLVCILLTQPVYQFLHLAVVTAGQRQQPDLFVSGVADDGIYRSQHLLHGTLTHGAGDHSRVTKPATARATSLNLNRRAIVRYPHKGDDKSGRRRWQHRHDALGDRELRLLSDRSNLGDCPLPLVVYLVQTRYVYPLDPRQFPQLFLSRTFAQAMHHVGDLDDHLFPFTNDEQVDEIAHRLRVVGGVPASDDQRKPFVARGRQQGHPGQVQKTKCVAVELLVR